MENSELRDLLGEEIESQIGGLTDIELGSKEYSAVVEGINKLYRLRIDETKNELDYFEKQDRRAMEKEQHEAEDALKRAQMAQEADFREREELAKKETDKIEWIRWGVGLGVQVLITTVGVFSYGRLFNRGLKFEEDGTFTSTMMKGLMSKMPNPWRK